MPHVRMPTMKFTYSKLVITLLLVWWSNQVLSDSHAPLVGLELLEIVNQRITNIDTEELSRLIEEDPSLVIIDVRQESEINGLGGMIDGHREIILPRGWLEFRMPNEVADKDTPIVVYCGINQRSPLAADTLREMGYTNVKNYAC